MFSLTHIPVLFFNIQYLKQMRINLFSTYSLSSNCKKHGTWEALSMSVHVSIKQQGCYSRLATINKKPQEGNEFLHLL